MNLKRRLYVGLLVSIAALVCVGVTACKKDTRTELTAPTELKIEDETLTWGEVKNAVGYLVDIEGKEYEAESNSLDVFLIMASPKTYEVRIQALGDWEAYEDSLWSEPLEYTLKMLQGWGLRPINDGAEYEIDVTTPSKLNGKLAIPSANPQDGKPITKIANNAFKDCTGLTGVLIPNNVEEIGSCAFQGCTNLKRVSCSAWAETIGATAFQNCSNLIKIDLPDGITKLGLDAFYNCSSLSEIKIPVALRKLENQTFYGCSSLTEIIIPPYIETIGRNIFGMCKNLSSLTVSEENEAFQSGGNCIIRKSDNELVTGIKTSVIPDYVKTIGESAFFRCEGLTEITVPGNVKTIKDFAFSHCSNLKSITLSEGIKVIGRMTEVPSDNQVFYGCSSLTEIEIPASAEFIAYGLTCNCINLTSLTVKEGNAVYKSEGNCIIRKSDNEVVSGCKASIIPDYATSIGAYAFYSCPFTNIVIPEGVEKIGKDAFSKSGLIKAVLPSTLKTIGAGAFDNCLKLRDIQLPYGVTSIGINAFATCSALKYIAIPESVKEIGGSAFMECYFITVVLPGSVETIGPRAFDNATIYTSASKEYPAGWYRKNSNKPEEIYSWAESCDEIFECTFGYDNKQPYVVSWAWTYDTDDRYGTMVDTSIPMNKNGVRIPYREGYTFMGWTTEKGSDTVVYGKTKIVPGKTEFDPYYTALPSEVLKTLPLGTVLYAVWLLNG